MIFFDISNIAFTAIGYSVSYIELLGTLFGFLSVVLAARANILTWPTGIANEFFLFFLFYQVQLYADMFLQVYFLLVTLMGWYYWGKQTGGKAITILNGREKVFLLILLCSLTFLLGNLNLRLHIWLPQYFPEAAAFPFVDALVMTASILATVLLAQKKIETWGLWLFVDLLCVVMFFQKGIYFLSLEYLLFLGIAGWGLFRWRKMMANG